MSSVCQAEGKNRGKACHEDSEHLQDHWERGITQNCLPSLDHGTTWNRSESSLNLANADLNRELIHGRLSSPWAA